MSWLYGGIAAVVYSAILVLVGYHFGGESREVKTDASVIKADSQAIKQDAKEAQADNQSEAQYVSDLKQAQGAPLVIDHPIWVRPQLAVCPSVPAAATVASGPTEHSEPGGADEGSRDGAIRARLGAFKTKYEDTLAGCRDGARKWQDWLNSNVAVSK